MMSQHRLPRWLDSELLHVPLPLETPTVNATAAVTQLASDHLTEEMHCYKETLQLTNKKCIVGCAFMIRIRTQWFFCKFRLHTFLISSLYLRCMLHDPVAVCKTLMYALKRVGKLMYALKRVHKLTFVRA
jgi:hypothetical protein